MLTCHSYRLLLIFLVAFASNAYVESSFAQGNQTEQPTLPSVAAQKAADHAITEVAIRADIKFLADDLLEGRGPGTRGDLLGQRYITAQFQLAGLEPAAKSGGWVQNVPLVGVTTAPPKTITFQKDEESLTLKNYDDYIVTCGQAKDVSQFENAELLFAGYGIQAPEFGWDDFKDVDVRGKILVVMNNDPADDPKMFAGRTRLYYGRWDYKYAKAAELGAAGVLIIHTTPSAGYPYQVVQTSWTGEQMALGGVQSGRLPLEGWLSEDAAKQLVKFSGHDLDALRSAAKSKNFKPVSLGTAMSTELKCRVRERESGNVLGVLKGSDPVLSKEWIVYTAHHDHIGMTEARDEKTDNIYNGAIDNASGVGLLLAIARAMDKLPEAERPKRSILFASVAAEEQGLLGSAYLAQNPPIPTGRLAAVINIDGINVLGPTKDVVVIGKGKSDMDKIVERLARWQKRVVVGDQFPDRGSYYRSDQFSLAKVGVPGVYLSSGVHVIGKPDGWGKEQLRKWTETIYHQTSDEYDENWDLRGAIQDAKLLFHVGVQAANQNQIPAWIPGDEFEAARLKALAETKTTSSSVTETAAVASTTPQPDDKDDKDDTPDQLRHEDLDATLWVQTSGEYFALARQAYQVAMLQLPVAIEDPTCTASMEQQKLVEEKKIDLAKLPMAVVMDVDETVLNNSAYQVGLIKSKSEYTREGWKAFCESKTSTAIPGAADFIKYCRRSGVKVLFVTNREHDVESSTRDNLINAGLMKADDPDIIYSKYEKEDWKSDKITRRSEIAKEYRILMLFGDDLHDFASTGHHPKSKDRKDFAKTNSFNWGTNWIILPNPNYGGWEQSTYDWNNSSSAKTKLEKKRSNLKQ